MLKHVKTSFILLAFFLMSCVPIQPKHETSYQQMQSELHQDIRQDKKYSANAHRIPRSVSNALMPTIVPEINSEPTAATGHRFNVTADKMQAKDFFMGLVEGTPYNMVVNPNVTGTISLNLKNVSLEETLEVVHDVYGYEFEKTSYGYEVFAPEMETEMFTVNYLNVRRIGKSMTDLSSGQISEKLSSYSTAPGSTIPSTSSTAVQTPSGSSVDTRSEVNFWRDLNSTLKTMVGTENGKGVVVNPQAGLVIVHAMPNELRIVGRYLDRIQANLGRQVILEAKILEVQLNDQYQSGINWNVFGQGSDLTNQGGVSQQSNQTFTNTDLNDFNTMFTLYIKGNFGALIKLLESQGNVQVLSSPRISTLNNQKAVIKVGQDQFFVTGVSTQNTVTANSTIPTQDVSLTPFFSGITLDVTPQISNNGVITLHIHPSVSLVVDQTKNIILGSTAVNTPNTLTLPLALSTIRESDNIVKARNGQIVVIGGLMQNTMTETTAGTPGLARIPFFGALFRRTQQVSGKSELVILLRPIIVRNSEWTDDLEQTSHGFNRLKRGFHTGGLPEVFGNQGEQEEGGLTELFHAPKKRSSRETAG